MTKTHYVSGIICVECGAFIGNEGYDKTQEKDVFIEIMSGQGWTIEKHEKDADEDTHFYIHGTCPLCKAKKSKAQSGYYTIKYMDEAVFNGKRQTYKQEFVVYAENLEELVNIVSMIRRGNLVSYVSISTPPEADNKREAEMKEYNKWRKKGLACEKLIKTWLGGNIDWKTWKGKEKCLK